MDHATLKAALSPHLSTLTANWSDEQKANVAALGDGHLLDGITKLFSAIAANLPAIMALIKAFSGGV